MWEREYLADGVVVAVDRGEVVTKKLPVIGTSAATTVFCSAKVEGPCFHLDPDDYLMLDGNGKITWENGTLAEPRPNALSLVNVDDCPGSTPTCRASCLASDHKVLTADLRYVTLRDLRVGDTLVSFDEEIAPGSKRRNFKQGVVHALRFENRETFDVLLASGKTFRVTGDHLWLTRVPVGGNTRWTRTDELQVGASVPRLFDEWVQAQTFEAGWLAGLYDGEGCLYASPGECMALTLSQKEGRVLQRAREALDSVLGLNSYAHCAQTRDVWQLRLTGGKRNVARVLGSLRPTRLLAKFHPAMLGTVRTQEYDQVVSVTPAGFHEIALIDVDAATMIVEGYPHHNCYVHGIEANAPDTYSLYRWNSARLRAVMQGDAWVRREWAYRLARWITDNAAGGFRWHVSGDVFSREYALWISLVCRLSPTVKHWIYTRSFDFVGDLYAPNLAVNLSADRDNLEAAFECAEDWPGTRVCLMVTDVDVCSGDSFAQALGRLRHGDVVFPDYPLRDGTELGREWFSRLPAHLKQMVCPVDRCGKSEERRCGPCDRCLHPVEVIS